MHLLNEHCATSELTALYFMYNHFLFNCFKFHFKSSYKLYHFKIPCFLLFLIPCFYCCEWLFHFLLCKALWITTVFEMCYINKLALPCLCQINSCRIYHGFLHTFLIKCYLHLKPCSDRTYFDQGAQVFFFFNRHTFLIQVWLIGPVYTWSHCAFPLMG